MPKVTQTPPGLQTYIFHGVQFKIGAEQSTADCPFCGKGGKFSVSNDDGQFRCFVCAEGTKKGGGNPLIFLRHLWDHSDKATTINDCNALALERGLQPETLTFWGLCKSILTGCWLAPGFDSEGKLRQLYTYLQDPVKGRWRWLPTPGKEFGHWPHGVNLYVADRSEVALTEGIWDGMALWEALRGTKRTENGLEPTASEADSILSDVNVLAAHSCGAIGEPLKKVAALFQGKKVTTFFDSDHPIEREGKTIEPSGLGATKRTVAILNGIASQLQWCKWGDGGFDPNLKSGWDVRDELMDCEPENRIKQPEKLLARINPVPTDWDIAGNVEAKNEIQPLACDSWAVLEKAWRKALQMRQSMTDVLSVMLAVALSTEQIGDQLFLMVIADAGSAKTRFCDAMLVSKNCYALEHLTGFHSGFKGPKNETTGKEEDYSLLARINRKTLITPEGDILMTNPKMVEIMSQQRRIFDGTSGASYKNKKEDTRHTGLRTPWIIAGTQTLLDYDQARMGDRFLRIYIEKPSKEEERGILRRVGYTAIRSVKTRSNCHVSSTVEEDLLRAYRLTGGYIDYLRSNAERLLNSVEADEDEVVEKCTALGEYAATLRARPHPDTKKDTEATKELPTRLTHQFVRLTYCLGVVINRLRIDADVMRRVVKTAKDTARGKTSWIVRQLYKAGEAGMYLKNIAGLTGHSEDRERGHLRFLARLDAVEQYELPKIRGGGKKWRLTESFRELCDAVGMDVKVETKRPANK